MPVTATQSRWRRRWRVSAARGLPAAPLGGLVLLEDRRLMDAAGGGWALLIGRSAPA